MGHYESNALFVLNFPKKNIFQVQDLAIVFY